MTHFRSLGLTMFSVVLSAVLFLPSPSADAQTTIPAPAVHATGLAFDGAVLYVQVVAVTYKVDPTDGTVLGSFPSPSEKGVFDSANRIGDIAFDGTNRLFSAGDGLVAVAPSPVFEFDTGGTTIFNTFMVPFRGRGIAFDGTNLYIEEVFTSLIRVTDRSGSFITDILAPIGRADGIEYDSTTGYLFYAYATVGSDTMIGVMTTAGRLIDSYTGPVSPTDFPDTGIAIVGTKLYVLGGVDADTIFIIDGVCGDGDVHPGEQCDEGAANGTADSCCESDCTVKSIGTACTDTDGNPCTTAACDGVSGECEQDQTAPDSEPCDDTDGNECTAAGCEAGVCLQDHVLVPASVPCEDTDGNECTAAGCDGAGVCDQEHIMVPDSTECADTDGNECTLAGCNGAGTCDQSHVLPSEIPCGDQTDTDCTDPDTCDGAGSCQENHAPTGAPCGDQGVECLEDDACDGTGNCTDSGFSALGTPCTDDGDICTDDECDGAGICQHSEAPNKICRKRGKCIKLKAIAAGKKTLGLLKAYGVDAMRPDSARLASAISKAQSTFTKDFVNAEATGGCLTSGDTDDIELLVDEYVDRLVERIASSDASSSSEYRSSLVPVRKDHPVLSSRSFIRSTGSGITEVRLEGVTDNTGNLITTDFSYHDQANPVLTGDEYVVILKGIFREYYIPWEYTAVLELENGEGTFLAADRAGHELIPPNALGTVSIEETEVYGPIGTTHIVECQQIMDGGGFIYGMTWNYCLGGDLIGVAGFDIE